MANNQEKKISSQDENQAEKKLDLDSYQQTVIKQQEQIISYLKKNEESSQELAKAVKFIKRHYFFRGLFNILKIALIVIIVILGIISWDNIVEFFNNFSGNIEQMFTQAVQEGIKEKINYPY